ncbi:MAG: hypothetical protein PHZ13_12120 [bacterium]|jgi:hypothetical protein|nr:hypothetical protein [bacterium]
MSKSQLGGIGLVLFGIFLATSTWGAMMGVGILISGIGIGILLGSVLTSPTPSKQPDSSSVQTYNILSRLMFALVELKNQAGNSDLIQKDSVYASGYQDGVLAAGRLVHDAASGVIGDLAVGKDTK